MATDHHHEPARAPAAAQVSARRERRLRLVLVLNLSMVAVQVVAGFVAHSVGLLSDAGHNLTDVAAVVLSLIAVRLARRPATSSRTYGWHRSTVLAAQANAAGILVVTVVIAIESIRRLLDPTPVHGGLVVVVALVALVVNGVSAFLLWERSADLNMRSALLHMAGDAAASAGVAVAGLVMWISNGMYWLDPLVSLGIGLLIGIEAIRLLKATTDVLLESTPDSLELDKLALAMGAVEGVESVHDIHAWTLSTEVLALSAHLVMEGHPSLESAQAVANVVRSDLQQRFGITHATLELECETCAPPGTESCAIDEAPAPTAHAHHH